MLPFTKNLEKEMNQGLALAAAETDSPMQRAERSFHVAETVLLKLKDYIYAYEFKDKDEEIAFFKHVKPKFQSQLLFWLELIQIESYNTACTKKEQVLYYRQMIERLKMYFEKNKLLYVYYKRNLSQEDDQLFLRETDCVPLLPEYNLDLDRKFSTMNSVRFAKFKAYEMAVEHLEMQINGLKNVVPPESSLKDFPYLPWCLGDAAFIELCKGLEAVGAFGNASFKQIMTTLGFAFSFQPKNGYRTYMDMLIRKKSPHPLFDKITTCLKNKMAEDLK